MTDFRDFYPVLSQFCELGSSNIEKVRRYIGKAPDGEFFINQLVKSDPRMSFGGTGNSVYGRELSREGVHEFVNKKTVYIKNESGEGLFSSA